MVEKEKSDVSDKSCKSKTCESTKGAILRAAMAEFAQKSVDGARTREIAARAGVNHAAINYYFGGKNEMYAEILKTSVEHFNAEYAEFMSECDAFIESGSRDKTRAIEIIINALTKSHKCMRSADFLQFMLLMKREETFPSKYFDISFEGSFRKLLTRLVSLIKILKDGIDENEARILAFTIIGVNNSLSSFKTAYLKLSEKDELQEGDIACFSKVVSDSIQKILI